MKQVLVIFIAVLLVQAAFAKSKGKNKKNDSSSSSSSEEKKKKNVETKKCPPCPPASSEVIYIKEVTVCEGQQTKVTCPAGSTVRIHDAFYGRKTTHTCRLPSAKKGENDDITCSSSNVLQVLRDRCNGQRECNFSSPSTWLDDPCRGTYKYLEASYSCSNSQTLNRRGKVATN